MPVLIKTILGVLMSTLGKMAMRYFANSKVIEELVMYGLEQLVKATDSKVDDEVLALMKEKAGEETK
ncbi:hypothetical protein OAF54_00080 [bacterium]|nr:hypothetical protein [bacterium]